MKNEELLRYAGMFREMREKLGTPYLTFVHDRQPSKKRGPLDESGQLEGPERTLRAPCSARDPL